MWLHLNHLEVVKSSCLEDGNFRAALQGRTLAFSRRFSIEWFGGFQRGQYTKTMTSPRFPFFGSYSILRGEGQV